MTEATNIVGNQYVFNTWLVYFLAFDFTQDMAAIQSNDNLDRVECAKLCRRETYSMFCYLNGFHYINNKEKMKLFTIIIKSNASLNFYVNLTVHTMIFIAR